MSSSAHAPNVQTFRDLTTSKDPARQILGYSVLLQLAAEPVATGRGARGGGGRGGRGGPSAAAIESARATARTDIDAAWQGPSVASLLRAIGATEATGYADRVQPFLTGASPDIRAAAAFAATHSRAATTTASGALVSTIPYADLDARVGAVTGDVPLGRTLFTRQGCAACHTASPEETEKGPYLGGIATRYSQGRADRVDRPPGGEGRPGLCDELLRHGRRPTSRRIRRPRRGNRGRATRPGGCRNDGAKDQIKARGVREGSVMPPGLADSLTLQEFASLLAYLGSTTGK